MIARHELLVARLRLSHPNPDLVVGRNIHRHYRHGSIHDLETGI